MKARLRHTSTLLLVVFVALIGRDARAVDDLDRLLVINGLAENLTLIDRAGDSVVANVLTLGLAPNRMREAADVLLLVNSISDDLWVIDKETYTVVRTVDFQDGDIY